MNEVIQPPYYEITAFPLAAESFFGLPYAHLAIEEGEHSDILTSMLNNAIDFGEMHCNKVFRKTSFTGFYSCLSFTRHPYRRGFIEIRKSPLIEVQEVRFLEQEAITPTVVSVEIMRTPFYSKVFFPKDFDLPIDADAIYPIEIDFTAGYSAGTAVRPDIEVPPGIKTGLKQHVAYMFENRGDVKGDFKNATPDEVVASYTPHRISHLMSL